MNDKARCSVNAQMLDRIYKNVKMGSDSMINIMSRVKDRELRQELTDQLARYEEYSDQAERMIRELGTDAREEGLITRLSAKIELTMNTMTDTSTSHLAQTLIESTTASMTDMTRIVREYENAPCSEDALKLARKIAEFEDKSIENLKKFL